MEFFLHFFFIFWGINYWIQLKKQSRIKGKVTWALNVTFIALIPKSNIPSSFSDFRHPFPCVTWFIKLLPKTSFRLRCCLVTSGTVPSSMGFSSTYVFSIVFFCVVIFFVILFLVVFFSPFCVSSISKSSGSFSICAVFSVVWMIKGVSVFDSDMSSMQMSYFHSAFQSYIMPSMSSLVIWKWLKTQVAYGSRHA